MRLVPRYTLVLALTATVVLAVVAYIRVRAIRDSFESDVWHDHRMVGRVLEVGIAELWRDAGDRPALRRRARRETDALIHRSTLEVVATRFAFDPDDTRGIESQSIIDHQFVSRFPVHLHGKTIGAVVATEPVDEVDDAVRTQLWISVGAVAIILAGFGSVSLLMGVWLVGRPVAALVEQARKIGRGEVTDGPVLERRDELGALAVELQQASETLAESRAKTEAETAARIRAVQQVRHSDRLATVGKLAAGIAHELGTPLSVVGGHAQMIAAHEVSGDAAIASAHTIDREATRMGKIVRQLLDFARRKGPEGTTANPFEIIQRCLGLLAVMAERHHVTCMFDGPETSLRVAIDDDSLQQVITNLVVNGIQAMPRGGKLAIAIDHTSASPDPATTPIPCVRIDIRDTGTGIPSEVQAHMFEPFFTTKEPGEGTGLGLSVVHGIVTDHGGWIAVDSNENGTVFSVFLQEGRPSERTKRRHGAGDPPASNLGARGRRRSGDARHAGGPLAQPWVRRAEL